MKKLLKKYEIGLTLRTQGGRQRSSTHLYRELQNPCKRDAEEGTHWRSAHLYVGLQNPRVWDAEEGTQSLPRNSFPPLHRRGGRG